MKSVTSQSGQVRFQIPRHWVVEPDGHGNMYYDPEPNSGTVRLSVLTFRADYVITCPNEGLESRAKELGVEIEVLSSDRAMIRYPITTVEDGLEFTIHYWTVSYIVRTFAIIANFSYTVAQGAKSEEMDREVFSWLDHEVRKAEFLDR